jgi:hypothetical protein
MLVGESESELQNRARLGDSAFGEHNANDAKIEL